MTLSHLHPIRSLASCSTFGGSTALALSLGSKPTCAALALLQAALKGPLKSLVAAAKAACDFACPCWFMGSIGGPGAPDKGMKG